MQKYVDNHEQKIVEEVLKKFNDLTSFFNTSDQDNLELSRVQALSANLINYPDVLAIPGRKLLREGDLNMVDGLSRIPYHFFLFSDILVYAKESQLSNIKQFKFKGQVDLRNADIVSRSQSFSTRNIFAQDKGKKSKFGSLGTFRVYLERKEVPKPSGSTPHDIKNAIQIMSGSEMLSIVANSFPERDSWLRDLQAVCDAFYLKRVFGIPLIELINRPSSVIDGIPRILRKLFDYFDNEQIKTEGLFRISASRLEVDTYRRAIDDGNEIDFSTLQPHTVANLIKLYLRELPEPLLTFQLYEKFQAVSLEIDPNPEESILKIRELLSFLPPCNKELIKQLTQFLARVSSFSEINKMNAENLGIVFEPTLLRKKVVISPHNLTMEEISNNLAQLTMNPSLPTGLISFFITHFSKIFSD